ncbi:hypothetical protein RIF29_24817 [Crotalaria pallida]|uniref:Reverse transcriptase zinc-binding domain-containing protein n=1 Tax=Crotalaria pallida TaxID=3830 RepID=A0AAN9EKE3_CROPI
MDMGLWNGLQWCWIFNWRRPLFQWEKGQVEELKMKLEEASLAIEGNDVPHWRFEERGNYSTKSFTTAVLAREIETLTSKNVWRGVAPPRVELLIWLVLAGKINTRSRLKKMKLIHQDNANCPFCNRVEESIEHLFLHCDFSWKLWCHSLLDWKIETVMPGSVETWFDMWMNNIKTGVEAKLWWSVFYANVWAIWFHRNKKVFENKEVDWTDVAYLIKSRVCVRGLYWCVLFVFP